MAIYDENNRSTHQTLALTNNLVTRQINFVLAYPQANIECDLYMEIPRICHVGGIEEITFLNSKRTSMEVSRPKKSGSSTFWGA